MWSGGGCGTTHRGTKCLWSNSRAAGTPAVNAGDAAFLSHGSYTCGGPWGTAGEGTGGLCLVAPFSYRAGRMLQAWPTPFPVFGLAEKARSGIQGERGSCSTQPGGAPEHMK